MPIAGQTATGNIYPRRFVKKDGAYQVAQCGAGESAFGISQAGTNTVPIPGAGSYAAVEGQPLLVFGTDENCLLDASAAVDDGAFLKSDADGKGVTAATGEEFYAIAERGAAAEDEQMQVVFRAGIVP